MRFSSLPFLFGFLPITLAIYFAVPLRWRNLALLLTSLVFYGWGEPIYISIMVLSILIDYTHGLLVEKYRSRDKLARWFVAESVLLNLGLLGFFKYWDFFAANLSLIPGISIPALGLPLPIGISFFTFQTMSYTIDVYRQDAPAQRNMVSFGAYVTMFPQLVAGPIVRYKDVAAELIITGRTRHRRSPPGHGGSTVGLAKKVLLANSIGALWDAELAAQSAGTLTAVGGWLGIAAFGFQIYFDFSGYSDMAIGMGQMLGFRLPGELQLPLYRRLRDGVLAAVAHFPDHMVPGISVHPPGRQPEGDMADGAEYLPRLVLHRLLARGELELHPLGPALLCVAHAGKVSAAGLPPKAAIVAAAFLHACGGVRGLGRVRHGGSRCLRQVFQNLLRQRNDCGAPLTATT